MECLRDQAGPRGWLPFDAIHRRWVDLDLLGGEAEPCPAHMQGAGDECRRPDVPFPQEQRGLLGVFRGPTGKTFLEDLFGRDTQILRHFGHGRGTYRTARSPRPAADDKKSLRIGLVESGCMLQTGTAGGVEVARGSNASAENNNGALRAQIRLQAQRPGEHLAQRIESIFQGFFAQTLDLAFEPTPNPDLARAVALPIGFRGHPDLF